MRLSFPVLMIAALLLLVVEELGEVGFGDAQVRADKLGHDLHVGQTALEVRPHIINVVLQQDLNMK